MIGQLALGYAGDVLGRTRAMTLTLSMACLGAVLSALAPTGSASDVYIVIISFRFLLGVGLGGVYPLSATKAAEDGDMPIESDLVAAETEDEIRASRGSNHSKSVQARVNAGISTSNAVDPTSAAWSFFWQGPGCMVPWLFAYIFTFHPSMTADIQWRLILGLGAIPICVCLAGSLLEEAWARQDLGEGEGVGVGVGGGLDSTATTATAATNNTTTTTTANNHLGVSPDKKIKGGRSSTPIATTINALITTSNEAGLTEHGGGVNENGADSGGGDGQRDGDERGGVGGGGAMRGSRISFAPDNLASESLCNQLKRNRNMYKLLATGGGWLLYDIVYYGVSLFGGEILEALENGDNDDVKLSNTSIRKTTSLQLIALAMGLPAVIFSIYLIKIIGTKRLQMLGFVVIAVCFVIMAVLFHPLKNDVNALFSVYCILLFALSFGPNVTTFILPAEVYPKYQRATFNGISAACGKSGAVIGAYVFGPVADLVGYEAIMFACAVLSLAGAVISWYFIFDEESFDLGASMHGSRRSSVNSIRLSVGSLVGGRLSVGERGGDSGSLRYGILINDDEEKNGGEII